VTVAARKEDTMTKTKTILAALFALSLTLGVVGCGEEGVEETPAADTPPDEVAEEAEEAMEEAEEAMAEAEQAVEEASDEAAEEAGDAVEEATDEVAEEAAEE